MIRSTTSTGLVVALALFLIFFGAQAAFAETGEHNTSSGHEQTHEFHPNFVALFVGLTYENSSDNDLALGIEYERRLNKSFGIGVLAEHTGGDLDFWVYAAPFAYHTGRWKFYAAPGVEDGEHGSEFLLRLGAEYAFEVGSWEISPQFDVDFVDGGESYVAGVTIGRGF